MNKLLLILAALLLSCSRAQAIDVPPFTPNVVQTANQLPASEVREINAALERIANQAGIRGAVYILESLDGDSVEAVAERAFDTWRLGEKGKDNGLLLVLALKDRRARFEVGYGLEGTLPDLVAKRALDDVMKPLLRQGENTKAIVAGFSYLAAVHMKSPDAEKYASAATTPAWTSSGQLVPNRGLVALGVYLVLLWFTVPVAKARARSLARALESSVPEYRAEQDTNLQPAPGAIFGTWGSVGIKLFLSVNPGAFIFLGAGFVSWLVLLLPAVMLAMACACFWSTTRHYRSPEAWRAYTAVLRAANARLVHKGFKREVRPGVFEYTPAWFTSSEYRKQQRSSSSSSGSFSYSSSSSSSSSSSGGGRSGGGGASTSW